MAAIAAATVLVCRMVIENRMRWRRQAASTLADQKPESARTLSGPLAPDRRTRLPQGALVELGCDLHTAAFSLLEALLALSGHLNPTPQTKPSLGGAQAQPGHLAAIGGVVVEAVRPGGAQTSPACRLTSVFRRGLVAGAKDAATS
jgi:hypothetical protein